MTKPVRFSMPKAISFLSSPKAPRVFNPTQLVDALDTNGIPVVSPIQLHRLLSNLVSLSLATKVHHGVYLNSVAKPTVTLDEAAGHIRSGAIISMQTVLGRWGVLNNPVPYVSCVIPDNTNPATVKTSAGVIEFFVMRSDMVHRPDDKQWNELAFTSAPVPTTTPEKALLDWLWLSSFPTSRSRLSPPPLHDIELDDLNLEALDVLAGKMGLEERLAQFKSGELSSTPSKPKAKPGR